MGEPKTYTLTRWFWPAQILLTLIVVFYLQRPYPRGAKWFMSGIGLLAWYQSLVMPLKVQIDDGGWIVAQGVLKTTRVPVAEVVAVEIGSKASILRYRTGKIVLSNFIQNIREFYEEVKRRNPLVVEEVSPLIKFGRSPKKVILLALSCALLALLTAALALKVPAIGRFFK